MFMCRQNSVHSTHVLNHTVLKPFNPTYQCAYIDLYTKYPLISSLAPTVLHQNHHCWNGGSSGTHNVSCVLRAKEYSANHILCSRRQGAILIGWCLTVIFLNAWLVDFLNLIPEGRDKNFLAHIFTSKTVIK